MNTESTLDIRGKSLIAQNDGADSSETTFAIDPATGQTIEPAFHSPSLDEVNQAADLAAKAFPAYSKKSGAEKAGFLREIAAQIEALGDALTRRAMLETGLPEARIKGETARTAGQLRLFAAHVEEGSWVDARIETALPERAPLPKPDIRSMRRPLGPVAVFAASNFPLAFSAAGGDTASALAAGCPVIVKAHSSHPGAAELVGRAVRKAAAISGMPDGVFSLLFGGGRTVGAALVVHPAIKAVGFTGSTSGGTALMKLAASRPEPIPVYAEMGSVNPVFILPGSLKEDVSQLAAGLHVSATMGVGQFCTNPGVILVPAGAEGDTLVEAFSTLMGASAGAVMLNPTIHAAYSAGVAERAANPNVRTRVSKTHDAAAGQPCIGSAAVFETTAAQFLADASLGHELFGPGTIVVRYRDPAELLQVAESFEGQLTGAIHGSDAEIAANAALVSLLERKVGRLLFNGFPTGVEVCHSMVHGGPFPATSDGRSTSVGTLAIERFVRLIAYQNWPQSALPPELRDDNPLKITRLVNGVSTNQ